MLSTEKVPIDRAYPSTTNPREDMGDIEALAATFAANAERPGEPVTPPLLVVDGNSWRIVDGERRWRAMRHLGTAEFTALVAADMDEANAALAMLATDSKQPLTASERAQGVQQALLLGVEPDTAAAAARIDALDAYRVKKMLERGTSGGGQATLDQLLAAARLADGGDDEAAGLVMAAGPAEWERVCEQIRLKAEHAEAFHELAAVLDAMGIAYEVIDTQEAWYARPDGKGWNYRSARSAVSLESLLGALGTDGIVCKAYPGGDRHWLSPVVHAYFINAVEAEDDPEKEAMRAELERHEDAWGRDHDRRRAFLGGWANAQGDASLERWLAADCIDSPAHRLAPGSSLWFLRRDDDSMASAAAAKYVGLLSALTAEGYALSPAENELRAICTELAAREGGSDE